MTPTIERTSEHARRDAELQEIYRLMLKLGITVFEVTDYGYRGHGPMAAFSRTVEDGK